MKYLLPLLFIFIYTPLAFSKVTYGPFDNPALYQAQSAKTKLGKLMEEHTSSLYDMANLPTTSSPNALCLFSVKNLRSTFSHGGDVRPKGRKVGLAPIHTYGSLAPISFIVRNKQSAYTGILESGAIGMIRLSLAKEGKVVVPGAGIKFLIDGSEALNLHVMYQLTGQGENQNFFAHPFSNKIDAPPWSRPDLILLSQFFKVATKSFDLSSSEIHLNVAHLGTMNDKGIPFTSKTPSVLKFKPSEEVQMAERSDLSMRERLAEIPEGTVLFHVYGVEEDGTEVEIGDIVLNGKLLPSKFGDHNFFTQHFVEGNGSTADRILNGLYPPKKD